MENSTSFHNYGDLPNSPSSDVELPNSPSSDVLQFCMDSNEHITIQELLEPYSPNHEIHEPEPLEPFFDPGGPFNQPDDDAKYTTNIDNFVAEGQDEDVDENAGHLDINNDPLLGNNHEIFPFEGQNDDRIWEFPGNSPNPIEEAREESENAEHVNLEDYESSRPLTIWPPQPVPFSCSSCQVLRDIVHSNGSGTCVTKLEIHGRVGILCHGVIEVRYNVDENPSVTHKMIDFCLRSMDDVKKYILQYCQERKEAGFVMAEDPLSTFYSALCVELNRNENANTSGPNETLETETGEPDPVSEDSAVQLAQRSLAAQRKRTANLKLSDLVEYFHMTIEAASKRLAVCPTAIKRICRKYGLRRWPHRKIKSIERKILNLENKLSKSNGADDARLQAHIQQLQQERDSYLNVANSPNR